MSKVTPIRATRRLAEAHKGEHSKGLSTAMALLKISAASFDEAGDLHWPLNMSDVRKTMTAAFELISGHAKLCPVDRDDDLLYEALGLLTLINTVITSGADPRNGMSISPLKSGILAACDLVSTYVEGADRLQVRA
jgi:hypothetical protein